MQDAEIAHSSRMPSGLCKVTHRIGMELRDGYNLGQCVNHPR